MNPRATAYATHAIQPVQPHAAESTEYHVLIVDDSPEDRFAYRRQLQKCGTHAYAITEAQSGAEGLEHSRAAPPDCVLLDYHLPDLDGVEFLARLRATGAAAMPAVVMLTGQGNEALAVAAIKAGAEDYLVKGISSSRLCHAVPHAIRSMSLRRALAARALEIEAIARERERLIGELEERAQAMALADRRKDEFLATLAHELRNPLAPIRSAMHALNWMRPDDAQVGEVSAVVDRQVSHLAHLVDDLTDVARITGGKITLRREHVLLAEVLRRVLELCAPLLRAHRQDVRVTQPDRPVWLDADPVRLVQILANILGNAAKYSVPRAGMRDPAPVDLDARVDGGTVTFTITDHGIGIEARALPHIFEIFRQVRPGSCHGPEGLGIGLALARQFARLHGGDVFAHSAGPGQGSTFIVSLPIAAETVGSTTGQPERPAHGEAGPAATPEDCAGSAAGSATTFGAAAAAASDAAAGERAASAPPRVLLVDDNVDAANMLEMLFEVDGYDVSAVYSGAAALEQARALRPDYIVMDLGMPGMDGYATMRALRGEPGLRDCITVALTGWNHPGVGEAVQAAGFDHHLVKPVEYAKLKALLQAGRGADTPRA